MDQPSPVATGSARAEWATTWQLPLVGMLGMAAGSMFNFSAGVLMLDMTHNFGWTRAQFSLGFTVGMLLSLLLSPLIGWIIQRIGPRRAGLYGIWFFTLGFSALGLANGRIWNWLLLCALHSLGSACVSPSIWLTAVVGRFSVSRGLAIATVLAGLGIASTLWPIAAAFYLGHLGWRLTFPALALSWAIVVWPLAYMFLYGAPRTPAQPKPAETLPVKSVSGDDELTVWGALRSRTVVFLLISNCMYAVVSLGLNLHMVPILQSAGFSLLTAAGIASAAGLVTLVGRVVVGFVLDHLPARRVGAVIFLLPAAACLLLLLEPKGSLPLAITAVILLGLGAGGEMDLVTYIASRNVPTRLFSSVYTILLAILGTASSFGPVVAGALFDRTGSYDAYLILVIPMVLIGALLIWFIPEGGVRARSDQAPVELRSPN